MGIRADVQNYTCTGPTSMRVSEPRGREKGGDEWLIFYFLLSPRFIRS